jgi:hypothetical protein
MVFNIFKKNKIDTDIASILGIVRKKVELETKPLNELATAIVTGATNSRDAVKPLVEAESDEDRLECEMYAFYEFVYFYLHMTMRRCFTELSSAEIRSVQEYIGPLMANVAVDAYFAHWPSDMKEKMWNEFYENVNHAELEYGRRQKIASLFLQAAWNVADVLKKGGSNRDPELISSVSRTMMDEVKRMNLDELVGKIRDSNSLADR